MSSAQQPHFYSPFEEWLNVSSHAVGLVLSIIGLALLVVRAMTFGTAIHVVSFAVFGASLVALYAASTLYHSTENVETRVALRIVDHASIYVLIAGTYTPFALITLHGPVGWAVFGVAWSMAAIGVVAKLFFTGRFNHLSTALYVFMGWIILFAIKPLIANLSTDGLVWLFAGGVSYTVGAILYSIRKLPFGHAAFHVLVLLGSACHFVSVYLFVLNSE